MKKEEVKVEIDYNEVCSLDLYRSVFEVVSY